MGAINLFFLSCLASIPCFMQAMKHHQWLVTPHFTNRCAQNELAVIKSKSKKSFSTIPAPCCMHLPSCPFSFHHSCQNKQSDPWHTCLVLKMKLWVWLQFTIRFSFLTMSKCFDSKFVDCLPLLQKQKNVSCELWIAWSMPNAHVVFKNFQFQLHFSLLQCHCFGMERMGHHFFPD